MKNYKITSTKLIIGIIITLSCIDFYSAYLYLIKLNYYNTIGLPENISGTLIASLNKKEFFVDLLYSAGFFICGMIFVYWLTEAYLKLKFIFPELSGTNSQILLSWFIPVINFFKPYNLMIELFAFSKKLLENSHVNNELKIYYVKIWWPLWLIDKILFIYKSNFEADIFDIEANINLCMFNLICILSSTLLSVATISMIANYAKYQNSINSLIEENMN